MNAEQPQPRLPPGPRYPRFIQMFFMIFHPLKYLRHCSRKYGTIFSARGVIHPTIVVLSDADAIETAFRATSEQLSGYPSSAIFLRLLGEESFLFRDGPRHRAVRSLLMPTITRTSTPDLAELISTVAADDVADWPVGGPTSLLKKLQAIAFRATIRRIVGLQPAAEKAACELLNSYRTGRPDSGFTLVMFNCGSKRYPKPIRLLSRLSVKANRIAGVQKNLRRLYGEELDRKLESAPPAPDQDTSYLDAVVREIRESDDEWSRDEILDNLNLLVITGHESAAVSTTWLLWELLEQPELLERVRAEGDQIPRPISGATLAAHPTPLLDAAILETLRVHTPVPVATRTVQEPIQVGDYLLPTGTTLLSCMYLAHSSEELWEDASTFRPQRFLEGKPPMNKFFPFGGGKHRCPGSDMGILHMKCLSMAVLSHLDLAYEGSGAPGSSFGIGTIVPDNGVPVTVRKRKHIPQAPSADLPAQTGTCTHQAAR